VPVFVRTSNDSQAISGSQINRCLYTLHHFLRRAAALPSLAAWIKAEGIRKEVLCSLPSREGCHRTSRSYPDMPRHRLLCRASAALKIRWRNPVKWCTLTLRGPGNRASGPASRADCQLITCLKIPSRSSPYS